MSTLRISIHAPLCGGRQQEYTQMEGAMYFNPRPPVRGATAGHGRAGPHKQFQSTPPCAGGDDDSANIDLLVKISIHAPLCGGRRLWRHCVK